LVNEKGFGDQMVIQLIVKMSQRKYYFDLKYNEKMIKPFHYANFLKLVYLLYEDISSMENDSLYF